MEQQLTGSKQALEEGLGTAVHFLAVPDGALDNRVAAMELGVRYKALLTGRRWPSCPGKPTMHRVSVYKNTTLKRFYILLQVNPALYGARAARTTMLSPPRRILLSLGLLGRDGRVDAGNS